MPLPTLPTTKEIRDRIITDIELTINQNTPSLCKAFNRVLAASLAFVFTLLYKFGQWSYKQIFTVTQGVESLELKGDQYGIPHKDSQATTISIGLTGNDGAVMTTGQQFRGDNNGLVYVILSTVEIAAGVVSVDALCLAAGIVGNLLNGDTLTILQPVPGFENQATVTATVVEGEDQESIEDYRARISEREKRKPQGGALVDYIAWAKEVAGVTRAFVYGHREESVIPPGYVRVYPLTDDDVSGRVPSSAKLLEIHDYIDDPARAPLQVVEIDVLALTERVFSVVVSALSPNTTAVRTTFEANLATFIFAREPQQFVDQTDVKNTVSRSYVESIAIQSGADSITLELFINGTIPPIESHTLLFYEVAKIGTITFP